VVGDPFEAGWECLAEEEVIMRVECYLVLVLAEMKEWVGDFRIMIKGCHHKLLWEARSGDLS